MKLKIGPTIICCAVLAAPPALAGGTTYGSVQIGPVNDDRVIHAGDLSDYVFGGGDVGDFTTDVLEDIHAELNGDGVSTDGVITVLAANTDRGLSLMWLIDKQTDDRTASINNRIAFNSNAPNDTTKWINDVDELLDISPGVSAGVFRWDDTAFGDGFAWAGLGNGDGGAFGFNHVAGYDGLDTIQYVTWNPDAGPSGEWEIAFQDSFSNGNYGADWLIIIPAPPAIAWGLAGLCMVALGRHRWKRRGSHAFTT